MNASRETDGQSLDDVGEDEGRVLLLLPTGRDAALARAELERAGLTVRRCRNIAALAGRVATGAAVALIAEEALTARVSDLFRVLDEQPGWSALPVIVLIRSEGPAPSSLAALRGFEQHPKIKATFLQRPVAAMSLVSTVRSGVSSRLRQYQVRDLLEQLGEEIRARDEFLAMLGHELRNPTTSIAHVAELFGVAGDALAPETAQWGAAVIRRQVRQLSKLLDALLDAARVQSGKIELQPEPVDLGAVVEQSLETLRPGAGARRIHCSLPEVPLFASGDPVRMRQIVDNLLENACKYTREDGSIRVDLRREDAFAVLAVRDDGRGLSEDALPHIFKPFYQDAATRPADATGLGLGLAIVDRLVTMHGGRIEARSGGAGRGAEFEVRLPAVDVPAAGGPAGADAAVQRRRVVIIEDNAEVADLLALLLESLGHEAHAVYEGAQGVRLVETLAPDMVFVDIGLPDISGREVARRVRSGLRQAAPPLVALTGYPRRTDIPDDAGLFDDYVLKPISRDRIEAILGSLPKKAS